MFSFQVLLAFWKALGAACHRPSIFRRMSLFGLAVSRSFLSLLPFWPPFIGLRVMVTWVNLLFLTLNCLLCLSKLLGTGYFVKKLFGVIFGLEDPSLELSFLSRSPLPPSLLPAVGVKFSKVVSFSTGSSARQAISTRLIHLGWEQCGHGLTSRSRKSCEMLVIQAILAFFDYPEGAALKLFSGTLKLRYSSTPFAWRLPTWPVQCQSRSSPEDGTSTIS